jgi:hypothetical protein
MWSTEKKDCVKHKNTGKKKTVEMSQLMVVRNYG